MASRRILSQAEVEALLAKYEPVLRVAFLDAFKNIRDLAEVTRIAEALERGDIEAALRAVHLDPAAFRNFEAAIAETYSAGGTAAMGALPVLVGASGLRVVFRFDVRNIRAETWLRTNSSNMVTEIVDDQRTMIRNFLRSGLEQGSNPRTTALDLVGRIGADGSRSGGVIGLTSSQESWVRNYTSELANNDPNALTRKLRDKRFDPSIRKAIQTGEPLSAEKRAKIIEIYRNRALRYRAETIARTETVASLNAARAEAMKQAIETGEVKAQQVTKVWRSARDARVRDTHRELDGQSVGLNEMFRSDSGALLEFPGDPRAPIEEIANCRCFYETRVDFLSDME